MMKVFFVILTICLFIPFVSAFGFKTHEWICEQIYKGNQDLRNKLDKEQFLKGCNAPDTQFNDQQYHHCYMAKECKSIDVTNTSPATLTYFTQINDCFTGTPFNCPALEKFNESLSKAIDFSLYVGAATHYYSDALVPVHQITGEDYWKCHEPFESKINDLVGNERFWSVSQKCTFSFPCKLAGKTIRKCSNTYTTDITFSYENLVDVVKKTDMEISDKLNTSHGDYSYLTDTNPTGYFASVYNKILSFWNHFLRGMLKK